MKNITEQGWPFYFVVFLFLVSFFFNISYGVQENENQEVARLAHHQTVIDKNEISQELNSLEKALEGSTYINKTLTKELKEKNEQLLNKIEQLRNAVSLGIESHQQYERVRKEAEALSVQIRQYKEQVTTLKITRAKEVIHLVKNEAPKKQVEEIGKLNGNYLASGNLRLDFTVEKGIKGGEGYHDIYLQIKDKDGNILQDQLGGAFEFGGKSINYTSRDQIYFNPNKRLYSVDLPRIQSIVNGEYRMIIWVDSTRSDESQLTVKTP